MKSLSDTDIKQEGGVSRSLPNKVPQSPNKAGKAQTDELTIIAPSSPTDISQIIEHLQGMKEPDPELNSYWKFASAIDGGRDWKARVETTNATIDKVITYLESLRK